MATIQIPSKNSAFTAFNKSLIGAGTMVMEVKQLTEGEDKKVLQGKGSSEGILNRSPTIDLMVEEGRKRLSKGEDQRVLEGVTHKLDQTLDHVKDSSEEMKVVMLREEEDKRITFTLKLKSSDAKGLSEEVKGEMGIHDDKCEMIKAENGFSRADLQDGFKLPSWGWVREKEVRRPSDEEDRKVCVVESKKRDASGCLKIEGGEHVYETMEKTRHLENELNKRLEMMENAGNDSSLSFPYSSESQNQMIISIPSSTISSNNTVAPGQKKFLFEKTLFQSDVNSLNRLLIPRRLAETYLPRLKITKGKYRKETLLLFDHQNISWEMKFEFWPSSQSYVLTRGWKDFVNRYQLRTNFVVRFYQHDQFRNKKHYGIEYVVQFPIKTIRLLGQDCHYLCVDAVNGGGGGCGNAGDNGSGESSSGQN